MRLEVRAKSSGTEEVKIESNLGDQGQMETIVVKLSPLKPNSF